MRANYKYILLTVDNGIGRSFVFKPWYMKKLNPEKLLAIDYAFSNGTKSSFADLGGVWRVDGGYTFYTLDKYRLRSAFLIDLEDVSEKALKHARQYPCLKLIKGSFGAPSIIKQLPRLDAIIMFDVLLHQVNPDWDHILDMYASLTDCFMIYNPQFKAEKTTRLFELGEKGYFANVPHDETTPEYKDLFKKMDQVEPKYNIKWREHPDVWQWGITNRDLLNKMDSLGFTVVYLKNCGQFRNLENFDNYAYVFRRTQSISL